MPPILSQCRRVSTLESQTLRLYYTDSLGAERETNQYYFVDLVRFNLIIFYLLKIKSELVIFLNIIIQTQIYIFILKSNQTNLFDLDQFKLSGQPKFWTLPIDLMNLKVLGISYLRHPTCLSIYNRASHNLSTHAIYAYFHPIIDMPHAPRPSLELLTFEFKLSWNLASIRYDFKIFTKR